MSKYIEEYLVSLGFDLDSKDGKAYLDMCNKIEKKQTTAEKTGRTATTQAKKNSDAQKSRMTSDKKEINLMGDMEKTIKQLGTVWAEIEAGNIFGAFTKGAAGAKAFTGFINNMSGSFGKVDAKAGGLKKTLSSLFGGQAEGEAGAIGDSLGGDAAAGAAGLGAAAAGAGIVAGIVIASVASIKMADGLAQSNIEVENMARQMWITDSAAWKLSNTLSSMGKGVGDLNTIALNPVLKNQFETLQQFQQTTLQLPADFQQVNDKWATGVDTANEKLKLSITYMKEIAAYDLSKVFEPIAEGWNNFWADFFTGIGDSLGGSQAMLDNTLKAESTGATTAPQSPINYATGAQITNSPNITVNATSNDPQSIASAVAGAVKSSYNETALINSLQGINR